MAKPLKEIGKVIHDGITKDLGLSIGLASQTFGQMRDQSGNLSEERLLGKLHGFVKPSGHAPTLLLIECRVQLLQVGRSIHVRKIPLHETARSASRDNRPDCR